MRLARSFVFCFLLAACITPATADEVQYFRSDRGLAANDKTPLPGKCDESELVWRIELGPGHSTPCVTGDAIYLTSFENKKLFTLAVDRATGKLLWKQPAPAKRLESFHPTGSPAAATPAFDGEHVYSFFGSYGILCYDLAGKLVWSREFGPFQDEFGAASSPVLVDGMLLLAEDHDAGSFLLCMNAADGKNVWRFQREGLRSYSTPVIWTVQGLKLVVVAGALELKAYSLDTGKPQWTIEGLARIVNTTPAAEGNRLYVATWSPGADSDGRISMDAWPDAVAKWDKNQDGKISREETDNKDVLDRFYRIDTNQDLGLSEQEWMRYARVFDAARNSVMALQLDDPTSSPRVVWQYDRGLPYVSSPLVYRDKLYLVKDGGIVTSLSAADGSVLKQARMSATGAYFASPVAGDGKIYLLNDSGVLTILTAADKWEVLAERDFAERSTATPVIAGGQVFVRTAKALYCYGAKGAEADAKAR